MTRKLLPALASSVLALSLSFSIPAFAQLGGGGGGGTTAGSGSSDTGGATSGATGGTGLGTGSGLGTGDLGSDADLGTGSELGTGAGLGSDPIVDLNMSERDIGTEFADNDLNNDDYIDRTEFDQNFESNGRFDYWDRDEDGLISDSEFSTALGGNTSDIQERFGENPYSQWDLDEELGLNNDEITAGLFDNYDADQDGFISSEEFAPYSRELGEDTVSER